jgi:cytidylate kinase
VSHPSPRSVDKLVEEQVARWLEQERRRKAERVTPVPIRPVVTVSRQAGARGTEVARLVAERLGFRCWDQELLHRLAEEGPVSERLLSEVDEHAANVVQDLLGGVLMGDEFTQYAYVEKLLAVFSALARSGSAVIVGRGAQFALESHDAFRVRIVCATDARVHTLAGSRGLAERDARKEVERIDKERLTFVRNHFRHDAADPSAYDLVVNTTRIAPQVAAEMIASAYRIRFPEITPSSREASSSARDAAR